MHSVHLRDHKVVGEVSVGVPDKSFRTVAEPNLDDLPTDELLTNRCERVAQVVLFAVGEHPFEDSVGVTVGDGQ